jgi:hypothetical protein
MRSRWQLCVLLVVAACSDNATPSATSDVGPGGGQVSAGNGASVSIPSGALIATLPISVTATTALAPADTTAVSTPYLFGPEGTQFAQPVTITLAFSSDLLPADSTSSDVVIYTAPQGSSSYQELPTTLADAGHVLAQTNHFSVFVAAVKHAKKHDMAMGEVDLSVAVDAGADLASAAVDAAVDLASVVTNDVDLRSAAVVDAGVDLATSVSIGDLSPAADLNPVDGAGCTPAFNNGGTVGCTVSATCSGHTYEVRCQVNACGCYVDNASNFAINAINACAVNPQTLWTSCGFP